MRFAFGDFASSCIRSETHFLTIGVWRIKTDKHQFILFQPHQF